MRDSLKVKFISSLEKCFWDENIEDKPTLERISMLRNEHLSVQVAMIETGAVWIKQIAKIKVISPIADCITLRGVEMVPVEMPITMGGGDDYFLRKEPGFYPDLLTPLRYEGSMILPVGKLQAMWVDIRPEGRYSGEYPITVEVYDDKGEELLASTSMTVDVIALDLPEQRLLHTEWFYADTLAAYYNVETYSERHWEIIENYLKSATDGGVNMILTPLITLPLDTTIGKERPTFQLVDVTIDRDKYTFDFDKLDRWIDLLLKYRVKCIEIGHLFTQWGAEHAPKVMATVDGEYKRIFGWEDDATGEEYVTFLRALLTETLAFLKAKGVDKMCRYHISDEPNAQHLENYLAAKKIVQDIVGEYPIMDALSNVEYYKQGVSEHPVPTNMAIEHFLTAGFDDPWVYYCCCEYQEYVSNRFIAMPSARNRIIGTQMYKFGVNGFLHWGFNFYYNRGSDSVINPYITSAGDWGVSGGDSYMVYPAHDGTAYDSVRFLVFKHALEDMRAYELCERLYGKDYVLNLIEGELEEKITFKCYPHGAEYILNLREKVNKAIKAKI